MKKKDPDTNISDERQYWDINQDAPMRPSGSLKVFLKKKDCNMCAKFYESEHGPAPAKCIECLDDRLNTAITKNEQLKNELANLKNNIRFEMLLAWLDGCVNGEKK